MRSMKVWKGKMIAHRGLHDSVSMENSLSSFQKAIDLGIPIEFDVHLLKDGKIIVFHDDYLKRMTGDDRRVEDCSYEEIKGLPLLNSREHIPLLEEVLNLVSGKVPIDIELKCHSKRGTLEKALCSLLDSYRGEFVVKSFFPYAIWWFRRNRPQYLRGLLLTSNTRKKVFQILLSKLSLSFLKPDFLGVSVSDLAEEKVQKYRKKHLIFAWTIRSKIQFSEVKEQADSFLFENFRP